MAKFQTFGLDYAALRKECLEAVKQWPGCESVAASKSFGVTSPAKFSVRITFYGKADVKTADRAMICVQREKRRKYHLLD